MSHLKQTARQGLVILPAVILGARTLMSGGAAPLLWGQQLAAWVIFGLLAWLLRNPARRLSPVLWAALLLIPLGATLLGPEAGGARRWLDLAVFNVNSALLVLPGLLAVLQSVKKPHAFLLAGAAVLSLQPDAAQLAAFAMGALPLLWRCRREKLLSLLTLTAFGTLLLRSLNVPVTLQPDPYAEGVLALIGQKGWLFAAAGLGALTLVPGWFLYRFAKAKKPVYLSLGLYYGAAAAFALTGCEPAPFLGLGLSPIAGYWLALLLK